MLKKETWDKHVTKFGVYESKRRLRVICRPMAHQLVMVRASDPSTVIGNLVHGYQEPATQRRLQFAWVIREILRRSREKRERIFSYCAPGVRRERLP